MKHTNPYSGLVESLTPAEFEVLSDAVEELGFGTLTEAAELYRPDSERPECGEGGAQPRRGLDVRAPAVGVPRVRDEVHDTVNEKLPIGTAVVILDQNGTGRKPHVQHRTTKDRDRDLHQIRP